eukprot:c21943_g1_i1 orf=292-1098(+)
MFPSSACLDARGVLCGKANGEAGDGFFRHSFMPSSSPLAFSVALGRGSLDVNVSAHGLFGSQFLSKPVYTVNPKGSVGCTGGSNLYYCRVWPFKQSISFVSSSLHKRGHGRDVTVDARVLPKEDVSKELENYEALAWTDHPPANNSVTKQGGGTGTRLFSRNFADILYSMAQLHSNLDEKELQLLEEEMLGEDTGRTPADYSRRADIFGRSAVVFAARKEEGDKIAGSLLELEEDIIKQDSGRTAADYNRRAEIFSKSAEIFTAKSGK